MSDRVLTGKHFMIGDHACAEGALAAGMEWDEQQAHSAKYDAERTADLFCAIVNRWDLLSNR